MALTVRRTSPFARQRQSGSSGARHSRAALNGVAFAWTAMFGQSDGWASKAVRREDGAVGDRGELRYALSGDARLAFSVRGQGPHEIVFVSALVSNQDAEPRPDRSFVDRLSLFATVVSYDQRGTGVSDPVSLNELPTLEGWADDLHAVVTAAGVGRVVLVASVAAGPMAALYAATRPEWTRGVVLINTF